MKITRAELVEGFQILGLIGLLVGAFVIPSQWAYRLTELGESLLEPLNALVAWAEANQARIGAARAAFDASALVAATALSRTEVGD
jgi:hypothetical protein